MSRQNEHDSTANEIGITSTMIAAGAAILANAFDQPQDVFIRDLAREIYVAMRAHAER